MCPLCTVFKSGGVPFSMKHQNLAGSFGRVLDGGLFRAIGVKGPKGTLPANHVDVGRRKSTAIRLKFGVQFLDARTKHRVVTDDGGKSAIRAVGSPLGSR